MALGRVVRTTAFKLSAIYLGLFSIFAAAFFVYVSFAIDQLLTQQLRETIAAELSGLADQARSGGLSGLVDAIDLRGRQPGASLYLITDAQQQPLAGNVSDIPQNLLTRASGEPFVVTYERYSPDTNERRHSALVQVVALPGGYHMLVGRDVGEREQFRKILGQSLFWAVGLMIGLALVSWFFVSRRVLKRIDSVSATSRRIMGGDLSGRLEITGTGDEFDRLAESLNAMLGRMETLLYGMKDVSDNIAHDLKTPLTRLRNRVEAALAAPDSATHRAALEATIEESDQLIKTFNALLMIARIEAGLPDGAMSEIDSSGIVRDVAELYEPTAEENGVALVVEASDSVRFTGSRELLGRALANLVDNAIKHRDLSGAGPKPRVVISERRDGDALVLKVADNGPGIPEADRERVLQRFVRLEKSRSQPGSGLGLSLVAAVVRLHHGTIELGDNAPGLVVTIRLPVK
ncbi:HAMP domain-containing sensor histidine kinase [soil metagenome]